MKVLLFEQQSLNKSIFLYPRCIRRLGFNIRSGHTKDFKKWHLIPRCLTLINIRYVSRVKWTNLGRGVAPSLTPRYSRYWKRSLLVALDNGRQLYLFTYIYIYILTNMHTHIQIYIYIYIYTPQCTHTYMHTHTHTHTHIYIYVYIFLWSTHMKCPPQNLTTIRKSLV